MRHFCSPTTENTVYQAFSRSASPKSPFALAKPKPVTAYFNGGKLTSDAGAILLQLADQKLRFALRTGIEFELNGLVDLVWLIFSGGRYEKNKPTFTIITHKTYYHQDDTIEDYKLDSTTNETPGRSILSHHTHSEREDLLVIIFS